MHWVRDPRVIRGCQIVIGVLFVMASLAKLGDLSSFATAVQNFRVAPSFAVNALAMTLPWIELLAALALVLNVEARAGAAVVTGLLGVFTLLIVVAMFRGLENIDCGCFGAFDTTKIGPFKLIQNFIMLALGWIALQRPR